MSKASLFSSLRFFRPHGKGHDCKEEKGADNWTETRCGQRDWDSIYRRRWQYDKKVRSTHGVNCTGSCSWDVYVKNGILVWETQRTDYPGCGEGFPNHKPRGCPRGATYSWYTYSPVRLNNLLPPFEACGASGMKAGLNGVPHLSILDRGCPGQCDSGKDSLCSRPGPSSGDQPLFAD